MAMPSRENTITMNSIKSGLNKIAHVAENSQAVRSALIQESRKLTRILGSPLLQVQHKHRTCSFPKVQNVKLGVRISAGCSKMADVALLGPRAMKMKPHAIADGGMKFIDINSEISMVL